MKIYKIPEIIEIDLKSDLREKIKQHIDKHLNENHTIPSIAKALNADEMKIAIELHSLCGCFRSPEVYINSEEFEQYKNNVRTFNIKHELKQFTDEDVFFSWLLR